MGLERCETVRSLSTAILKYNKGVPVVREESGVSTYGLPIVLLRGIVGQLRRYGISAEKKSKHEIFLIYFIFWWEITTYS